VASTAGTVASTAGTVASTTGGADAFVAFGSQVKFVETAGGITGAGNSKSDGGITGGGAEGVVLTGSCAAVAAMSATWKLPLQGSKLPLRSTSARRTSWNPPAEAVAGTGRQKLATACF
jgi:hypothetical protein